MYKNNNYKCSMCSKKITEEQANLSAGICDDYLCEYHLEQLRNLYNLCVKL